MFYWIELHDLQRNCKSESYPTTCQESEILSTRQEEGCELTRILPFSSIRRTYIPKTTCFMLFPLPGRLRRQPRLVWMDALEVLFILDYLAEGMPFVDLKAWSLACPLKAHWKLPEGLQSVFDKLPQNQHGYFQIAAADNCI